METEYWKSTTAKESQMERNVIVHQELCPVHQEGVLGADRGLVLGVVFYGGVTFTQYKGM